MAKRYTESKGKARQKFVELIMLMTDGGVMVYHCCRGHAKQVVKAETAIIEQRADELEEQAFLSAVASAAGSKLDE